MDDAALVDAARSGDETAWAAIYDRYADKLHDHCHRILRDRDEAADALHDAFLAASRNLHQLRDPSRLRPWLYSICRHISLRRLRARGRVELTDAPDEMSAPDDGLDRGVRAQEISELVWAAAAGLSGRDQALLDLHLRQGLEGQDLADAMGTTLSNSYVMLSRMRDQVERSLGALLIARMGRDDCRELDKILHGWDGRFSPLLRKRVARHVDGCEICSEKRRTVASPLALLAAAPLVPAPSLLKTRVISSIRNVDVVDGPHVPFTKDGYASLGAEGGERRIRAAWLGVAAAILLLLGGFFLLRDAGGETELTTAAGSATTLGERSRSSSSTSVDPSSTSTSVDGAAQDEGTDDGEDEGPDGGTDDEDPVVPPGGGSGPTTTRPAPTTTQPAADTTPPSIGSPNVNVGACTSAGRTVVISVPVSGGPTSVTVQGAGALSDDNGNGTWAKTFNLPGATPELVIVAKDAAGNTATRSAHAALAACPSTTTTQPATTSSSTTQPRPG
ncbi:MAG TPA: sigma-70 family RNA polymerase sigma factor [Acidimicrobiales bacterium]|nr:sigma-70 family RNA polymerase sigma factor [Acidimicrobiales bacterium]